MRNVPPSEGRSFHCLQATSHALQPMHTVVSVKKPIRCASSRRIAISLMSARCPRRGRRRPVRRGWRRACPSSRAVVSPLRRPARTLQVNALSSWIDTFGSLPSAPRSFALSPGDAPPKPQCHGSATWWMSRPSIRSGRMRSVTRARASISARSVSITIQPPSSMPALGGQDRVDLREHLRLQLRQPRQVAAHRARRVVLGEPERRRDERVAAVARGVDRVVRAVPGQRRRVAADLGVEQVGDGRLERLVVGRHRPVEQARGRVQPALAVGHHDERVGAADRRHPLGVGLGAVAGRLVGREVRHVVARPLALLLVPPDVLLALGPRPALGVGRRAVVEHAAVGRPRPRPLGRDPAARGVEVAGFAAPRLVDAVGVAAGVDPAARGRACRPPSARRSRTRARRVATS